MDSDKDINLDGYLKNAMQKNYYRKMKEQLEQTEDDQEFSDFEIDLYNMSKLNSRANRVGRFWEGLRGLLSPQLQNLRGQKLLYASNRSPDFP